jgi:hypothetical protein
MKDTKNIDVPVILDEINNTVMAVQQDSNVMLKHPISVAYFGMLYQRLSKLINPLNCLGRGTRVIGRNIFVDVR